jgi:hypothetical protein
MRTTSASSSPGRPTSRNATRQPVRPNGALPCAQVESHQPTALPPTRIPVPPSSALLAKIEIAVGAAAAE